MVIPVLATVSLKCPFYIKSNIHHIYLNICSFVVQIPTALVVLTAPVMQIASALLVPVPVVKLAPVARLVDVREQTANVDLTASALLAPVPVVKLTPVASLVDAREQTANVDLIASALLSPVPAVKLAPIVSLVDARELTANVDLTASALLVIVLASPCHELQTFEHMLNYVIAR